MEVNKELDQLTTGLDESVHLLAPGGRVLVLAYHSGEDKIVKNTFKNYYDTPISTVDGRVLPGDAEEHAYGYESAVRLVPVAAAKKASRTERESNPRSKSARLRVVERIDRTEYPHASGM
jgi:16S rRNA (cytosine1402-N4)-methyltransferase